MPVDPVPTPVPEPSPIQYIHVPYPTLDALGDFVFKGLVLIGLALPIYWHATEYEIPVPPPAPAPPAPGPQPQPQPWPPGPDPAPPDPDPLPDPKPLGADGIQLGKQFVPLLGQALGVGFDTLANDVEAGKSMAEADKHLKSAFENMRNQMFQSRPAPWFAEIVPPGTEPKDDASRKAYAKLARDFAKGLRGGQ